MKTKSRASGFAVINAVFLIIVLGALGAAVVTLSKTQQDTSVRSLQSARVYYGAKAGLEWGIHQAIAPAAPACAATTTFGFTQGALAGINVTVTCEQSTHSAGDFVYYLTSCATTGTSCASPGSLGNPGYAERRLEATVSNIP